MKYIYIIIFSTTLSIQISAQTDSKVDTVVIANKKFDKTRLDFAVPDIPAFKALGTDPSDVLRPSSPKDLSIMFGNFINSKGGGIIPQNFAAEVTPALLVKSWYTLGQYQTNNFLRIWTRSRFSVASAKDDKTGISSLAFGFRTTLLDNSDFRLHKEILNEVFQNQDSLTRKLAANRNLAIQKSGKTAEEFASMSEEERQKIYDSIALQQFDDDITKKIQSFKKDFWNAAKIDLAYSLLLQSPDSLLGNAKIDKHIFWLSWATPIGKNGQLLLGINDNIYYINNNSYNTLTSNIRYYLGTNKVKGLLECQYKNSNHPTTGNINTLYSSIGLEAAIKDGIWFHFATGVQNLFGSNAKSELISNINLYFTLPEKLKLF